MSAKKKAKLCYQLRLTLLGMEPPIWRRLEVPGSITLGALHDIVQIAMGWKDCHLHMFQVGQGRNRRTYSPMCDDFENEDIDENSVILRDVLHRKGSKLFYVYDFGDSWEHEIRVEKRRTEPTASDDLACLGGLGACPPEDSGGVWGYMNKLEVLRNPDDPYAVELAEWMGDDFDPNVFDKNQVDRAFASWNRALAST